MLDPYASEYPDAPTEEGPDPIGLERYRFLRFLSAGGMGEVWLVQDLHLRCELAMKVIGPLMQRSLSALTRFQEETRIAAQL